MAVSTTNAFSGPYIANGVTTVFPFTFKAPTAAEVAVLVRDSDGSDVDPGDYTVSINSGSGGSVSFSTAPADGLSITPYLAALFTQDLQFEDGSAWLAEPVNEGYDRSVLRDQVLKRDIDRGFKVPMGEEGPSLPSASARASKFPVFDATGENIVMSEGTGADAGLRGDLASTEGGKGAGLVNFTPYGVTYTTEGSEPVVFNVYDLAESGRRARQRIAPFDRGAHIGEQFSGLGIEFRPTGSLSNGPAHADIGFNVSVIKDGTNVGEVDGLNVVVRQAGAASDACAILTDVAGWNGGTGFWGQHEGSTKHIDGGGTTLLDIRTQMGIIDTVNNSSFGFFATPDTGTIGYGLLFITEASGGQFDNHIAAIVDGRTAFQVDEEGRTYVNAGDLETGQYARQECYLLEAASGNALAGHIEFNRYAAGSDWTSAEFRLRGSVDGSDAAASSPWMAFRGLPGGTSQITFGYGVGASAFDRVTIPIGGGLQIIDLPSFSYADDTAAAAGGIPVGGLYHTSGAVKVRLS
ncbi:hypothetical protein [Novosphingobium pentaromativorans]|uniref:Uncharacterized protein n=1 Tax=Novosphingobium pentaromativorans US6-1 TaxID=1088721 RepID=G6E8V5_9SPHN|nr:hypothetical protein [Novosphingobium pentaromativorans]AIT81213.1 hypothetical protein JI59_16210 [Novosphingobium pentaromativorans US6-1]EHJ62179.1 hypothetical protein NSU_0776 [Novosphingobium pentaromativorans US6-1]